MNPYSTMNSLIQRQIFSVSQSEADNFEYTLSQLAPEVTAS